MLGLSTVFVLLIFFGFSDSDYQEFEFSGISYDVRESSNGYTFSFDCSDGNTIRCFSKDMFDELGCYRIDGGFSEDGTIYFIKYYRRMDIA